MTLATILCAALIGGSPVQEPSTNLGKLQLYDKVRACSVKVYSEFGDDHYHGSGVAFKRYGDFVMIITNSHVVSMGGLSSKVTVKPFNKAGGAPMMPAYVAFEHRAETLYFDLAFLVVRDPGHLITVAERGTDRQWKGKTVYSCGNPHDEEFLVDHGKVLPSSMAPEDSHRFSWVVCHDAMVEHGNSGGGLFDNEGKLVGINTWLYDGKVGMAIDLDVFTDLFDFRATTIYARNNAWVKDTTLPPESSVYGIAIGKWTCDPAMGEIDPGGVLEHKESCVDTAQYYGSALVKMGDKVAGFNRGHYAPDHSLVAYEDARLGQIKNGPGGDVSFRINDKDTSDNSGEMTVFYVIMTPANLAPSGRQVHSGPVPMPPFWPVR